MKSFYVLEHSYELEDEYGILEENKFIGAFTTREKAEEAINELKDKEGFMGHPLECFKISVVQVIDENRIDEYFMYRTTDKL